MDLDKAPSRGPVDAPVTIVEFSDFECPYSAQSARNLRRLAELYPTQVRWVSKQFPLKFHKKAPLAHEAALAAGEQGRFFEMAQLIYQNQDKLEREHFDAYARELGLDMARFSEALDHRNLRGRVVTDILEARRLGVFATPTLLVNGQRVMGAKTLPEMRAVVEHLLRLEGDKATGK
jgi:protein-disulfide isomerase